jgi:hypothetical protein
MISYHNLAMRVLNHAPCVRGGEAADPETGGAGRGGGTDDGNGCSGLCRCLRHQKR